jgi:glycine cleavage system aminomethyltransferase T/glycine/D-amino acid oxidase-like deaminating enzyme
MSADDTATPHVPARAQVVVIGGGICGLSTAYHLAAAGCTDVVVLERHQLTSGTTWHAAGLIVSGGLADETLIPMFERSRALYETILEAETGQPTGYVETGYVQTAASSARAEAVRRDAAFQAHLGIEVHEITPSEIASLWPHADLDDVTTGFFYPRQGRVNPVDAAVAFARAARQRGVRIIENATVTGVTRRDDTVTGVVVDGSVIEADHVVNCGGLWARAIGAHAGVNVPLHAAEHYYVITEPIEGVSRTLPVLEDGERYGYYREEVGCLLVGLFEPVARAWHHRSDDPPYVTLEPDWDRILPFLDRALGRLRGGRELGIKTFFCGPESFTPDVSMLLGPAPELRNYWMLAGMNSLGILLGGGAGEVLADWILNDRPSVDVTAIEPARFGSWSDSDTMLADRVVEQLGVSFGDGEYPFRQPTTARNIIRSPLHERFEAAGALFAQIAGWEVPDVLPSDPDARTERRFGPQPWFDDWAAEHHAVRDAVGIFDMSMMNKIVVDGPDALRLLDDVSVSDLDVAVGDVVFTVWTDELGGIIAEITVFRLDDDSFMIVCGPEHGTRVTTWLSRHVDGHRITVTDHTDALSTISVMGPRSRELLETLTSTNRLPDRHPHLTWRPLELRGIAMRSARIGYVGELGYELYVDRADAALVLDHLLDAGRPFGVRLCGAQAMESLRMEKGNIDYAIDIDNTDTPLEVGLGFTIAWDSPKNFVGRSALERQRTAGLPHTRLLRLKCAEPQTMLHGHEVLHRDGVAVGHVRSASFGHTLGVTCGLAICETTVPITADWLNAATWTVVSNGVTAGVDVKLTPWFDPRGTRYRHL